MAEASNAHRRVGGLLARILMLLSLSFAALVQPAAAQSLLRDAETEALLNDMSRPLIEAAGLRPENLEIRGAGNLLGAEQSGQIAAVGFEMYLQLLEEAVALARGEPAETREVQPVIVELSVDAYLPPAYVMDEIERVDLYRRASGLGTREAVEDLSEELTERFGALPEPAQNLLGLQRVKLQARGVGATSVTYRTGSLTVYGVTADAVAAARIRQQTGATVGGREGRVTVRGASLGPIELAEVVLGALGG